MIFWGVLILGFFIRKPKNTPQKKEEEKDAKEERGVKSHVLSPTFSSSPQHPASHVHRHNPHIFAV
jgi:hypothetical protein